MRMPDLVLLSQRAQPNCMRAYQPAAVSIVQTADLSYLVQVVLPAAATAYDIGQYVTRLPNRSV
jgi:hypothetical protein